MIRARIELGVAAVFAVLTVVTLVWPTWIESLTGLEPDRGTGETEWWIVVVFGLVTIGLGLLGGRGLRPGHAGGGSSRRKPTLRVTW